jgi:Na+/H+-translocating membrane pyrophosphatase
MGDIDGKAQLILAVAVLLIVIAVIVALVSDDDVTKIIAIIGALAGLIAGWFGVKQAVTAAATTGAVHTQGPPLS